MGSRPLLLGVSLIVLLLAPRPSAAEDQPPSLEELRKGLAARDASFQNARFRATYHDKVRRNLVRAAPFEERVRVVDALVDLSEGAVVNGRARVEIMETPDPDVAPRLKPDEKWVRFISNVTKDGGKQLEGTLEGNALGIIQKQAGIEWWVNPAEALGLLYWSPHSMMFNNHLPVKIEGMEAIPGRGEALKVSWETPSQNPPGSAVNGTYWIAPAMGYSPLRMVFGRRLTPTAPWKEILRIENEGWLQVDGLWVPTKVGYTHHQYYNDGDYELVRELAATFEDWRLNRPVKDADYEIEFPDGTIVRDLLHDKTYVKGRVNDAAVARQASVARAMAAASPGSPRAAELPAASPGLAERFEAAGREQPFRSRTWGPWPYLAAAGVAALAAVGIVASRRRGSGAGTKP